jgi:hypothetical protein
MGGGEGKGNGITEVWVVADREKLPRSGAATAGLKGSSFQRLSVQSCYFHSFLFLREAWRWNGTKGKYIDVL